MHLHCLALLPLLLLPAPAGAAEMLSGKRYVRVDAPMGGDGLSWATAYARFQDALTDASQSQGIVKQIWVAAGTYKPTTNVNDQVAEFVLIPGVSIYGGFNGTETLLSQRDPETNVTIFSGDIAGDDGPNFANTDDNSYTLLRAIGNAFNPTNSILDGFTVTATHAPGGSKPLVAGLVLLNAGMTVRTCRFVANWDAGSGAAVTLTYGSNGMAPRFENCVFEGNYSNSHAGAVSAEIATDDDPLVFADCDFVGNSTPGIAGAMTAGHNTQFIRCRFINNSSGNEGGALGMFVKGLIQDCIFVGNHAAVFGGALYTTGNSFSGAPLGNLIQIVNTVFSGNSCGFDGGAVFMRNSNGDGPTVTNCTFANNSAARNSGGLYLHGSGGPHDGVMNPFLYNCVITANSDQSGSGESAQIQKVRSAVTISNCLVQGWTGALGGTANFGGDPDFQDANGIDNLLGTIDDNVRLRVGSPCFDAGDDALLPLDIGDVDGDNNTVEVLPLDLDGGARRVAAHVDLGAYELGSTSVSLAFCFGDGTDGACRCANQGAPGHGCASSLVAAGARLTITPGINPNTYVATCQDLPSNAFAHCIGATGNLDVSVFAGDGLLCLSGKRHRFGSQSAVGGMISAAITWPASAAPQYYQVLYRDPNVGFCSGSDINMSNGVALIH